jgi:hypothetical protein
MRKARLGAATMQTISLRTLAISLSAGAAMSIVADALAGGELVKFPEDFAEGIHYATVNRGNIREEIFTSRAAIDAAKAGQPLPSGTVITLVDYRDDQLFRYVVMEKRTGWGAAHPPEKRTGEWEYQAFNADRSVNVDENLDRCFSCHKPKAEQDFVHTLDRMKSADQPR